MGTQQEEDDDAPGASEDNDPAGAPDPDYGCPPDIGPDFSYLDFDG